MQSKSVKQKMRDAKTTLLKQDNICRHQVNTLFIICIFLISCY